MTEENKTGKKEKSTIPTPQELMEAGVHLGHNTSRWNPKMKPYLYGSRNDTHIFDLEKTAAKLEEAVDFLSGIVERGGVILFVGTKPAAKNIIKDIASELNMPYVCQRWLGGTLTNFKTINKRLQYYRDLEVQKNSGGWDKYVKKERTQLQKKLNKLHKQLEGIRNLMRLPEAVVISDLKLDDLAFREAKITKVPVVAVCDSNMNPEKVDYPIPASDDSFSSLKLIFGTIAENLKKVKPIKASLPNGKENNSSK